MRRSLTLLLFLLLVPSLSIAAVPPVHEFSSQERDRLFRPCQKSDPRERARCEARQLSRAQQEWGRSHPNDAFSVYDRLDLGGHHLRAQLQTERRLSYQRYWTTNRKTYSEFEPVQDLNTKKLPYLNDVREEQLDCMYVAHGRPRNLCLEWHRDRTQKMQAPETNS